MTTITARAVEHARSNAGLYVPLALLALLAIALLAMGWPTAGALVAGLGFAYAIAWFAASASFSDRADRALRRAPARQ